MTTRERPVNSANDLIDAVVEGVTVTVPCEVRTNRRVCLFPFPLITRDERRQPVSVSLSNRWWLVNDGVAGTLPVVLDDQATARRLSDAWVEVIARAVVDPGVGQQVVNWCSYWVANHGEQRAHVRADVYATRVHAAAEQPLVGQLPVDVDAAPALVMTLENPEVPA